MLQKKFGGNVREPDRAGTMVLLRDGGTHKCVGSEGGTVCNHSLHENNDKQTRPHKGRPQDDSGEHQQERGHTIQETLGSSESDLAVRAIVVVHDNYRISSGYIEYTSGLPVSEFPRQQQLAAEPQQFQGSWQDVGPVDNRPVRRPIEQTAVAVCQLETRSGSGNDRCVCDTVGRNRLLRVPTFLHDQQVPGQSATSTVSDGDNHTRMANTAVVRQIVTDDHRSTDTTPTHERSVDGSTRQCSSPAITGRPRVF